MAQRRRGSTGYRHMLVWLSHTTQCTKDCLQASVMQASKYDSDVVVSPFSQHSCFEDQLITHGEVSDLQVLQ